MRLPTATCAALAALAALALAGPPAVAQSPELDTFIDGGPSQVTRDRTPTFSFGSTTPGATFQCRVDGAGSPRPELHSCHTPYELATLPDGGFTFVVQAVAPDGTVDPTPAARAFGVDATAPDTTITGGPVDGGDTGERSPRMTYSSEPGTRFECRFDNVKRNGIETVSWQDCPPDGYSPPALSGGTHIFEVRAIDAAGNIDPSPAVVHFTLRACDHVVHFGLVEATADCLAATGTPDAPRWESSGEVRVNGIPIPAPSGTKVVLNGPSAAHPGGTVAVDNITLSVGGIELYRGRLEWVIPDGKTGDEAEVTRVHVGGQKLFGLTIQGDLALRFRRSAANVYSSILALHIALPDVFKAGPQPGAGGVTGDVAIRIDAAGVHLDGLKVQVGNAYIGNLGVRSVCLSFVATGANAVAPCQPPSIGGRGSEPFLQCATNDQADRWDGAAVVILPTPSKTELGVWAGLRSGRLAYAGGFVDNLGTTVPLVPGVFLQRVALAVCLDPPPFQIKGGAGISFGPDFNGHQAVRVDGSFLYRDAYNGQPWLIRAEGQLTIFDRQVASAYVQYQGTGLLDFGFNADLRFGPLHLAGGVDGWVETQGEHRFNVNGHVLVCVDSIACAQANAVISSTGVAGCITVQLLSVPVLVRNPDWAWYAPWRVHWESHPINVTGGAGYTWSTRSLNLMAGSCSIGPWQVARPAQALDGSPMVSVPTGATAVSLRLRGLDGPPRVTLVSPDGQRKIVVPDRPGGAFVKNSHLIASDPATQTTAIMITHPAAGQWRIEPHPGSPRVLGVQHANALPPATLQAGVGGGGHRRLLGYVYSPLPGQRVTFVERIPRPDSRVRYSERIVGRADAGVRPCDNHVDDKGTDRTVRCGQLAFRPAVGPSGRRTIVAYIEQYGKPRSVRTVAHYVAPPALRPQAPGTVTIVRRGRVAIVRWTEVPGAAGYNVMVRIGDGRRLAFRRSASTLAVRIPAVLRRYDVRAQVRALRRDGAVGAAAIEVTQ